MIQVAIPAELEPFVQGVVANGRYHNPTEVVDEALLLLARREQLLHDVKAGAAQLNRGEHTEYDDDSQERFVADIKAEEQNRLHQAEARP